MRRMKRRIEVRDEGDCLVTSAGTSTKLRVVLHVAAVDYRGPRAVLSAGGVERTVTSAERIRACTVAALGAASEIADREAHEVSVAFPLLGAGAGGLPVAVVCSSMIAGLREFFGESPEAGIELVVFAVPEPDRFTLCERLVASAMS
jgi:O-acetyl-ADP-ribose deacetylase (regulator of RNase III)